MFLQKTSDALGPGWYNFHKLNLARKVTYPQTFGGAPIVEHRQRKNECEFVKSLSMVNVKKMNAKADYLRLYEPDF
ncbi:uncharacterized protein CEXT_186471 [Caerostris extrusa]|uniref:Uncharacterized protein n=1 Tax=Caerostris extrusa TaxID=172846 RepID=A0AAV4W083_CAEEX|nr:uncharacterized protein CEXT_186471 [Caerostris extrusa]